MYYIGTINHMQDQWRVLHIASQVKNNTNEQVSEFLVLRVFGLFIQEFMKLIDNKSEHGMFFH